MIPETIPSIIDFFNDIKDPRIERKKCYPLIEVIVITLLAYDLRQRLGRHRIVRKNQKNLAETVPPLKNGIPKHDVYRRVFNRLDPWEIERCFMAWVRTMSLRAASRAVSLASPGSNGGSFDRKFIIPSPAGAGSLV
jgi:hypothetical protein